MALNAMRTALTLPLPARPSAGAAGVPVPAGDRLAPREPAPATRQEDPGAAGPLPAVADGRPRA